MKKSTSSQTSFLHVCALAILLSSNSSAQKISNGSLRGAQQEDRPSITSLSETSSVDSEHSRTRQLFGREFTQGIEALTRSHASIPLDHVGENQTQSSEVPPTNPLVGQPVYFEKQSDNPDATTNPYLRIVGGGASTGQRNFCMHLRWDSFSEQYLFAGCGGALISNCHVLTAAHCVAGSRVGLPDGVYCNAFNPFQGNYGEAFHFSNIRSVIRHPSYNVATNQNDIAILELETCVPNPAQFPPMKVANQAFLSRIQASSNLVVSGFGRLAETNPSQVNTLQQVAVPYIPRTACNTYYPGRIYSDMVCAGLPTGGRDACQGDSGGALFHQGAGGDTNQTAVGIVSWGAGCAAPYQPGVYSSVAYFYSWIKNIVCNHSRTNKSIPLCTTTNSLTAFNSCAALGEACSSRTCCGGNVCRSRTVGAEPTCSSPSSNGRNQLSTGRAGDGN